MWCLLSQQGHTGILRAEQDMCVCVCRSRTGSVTWTFTREKYIYINTQMLSERLREEAGWRTEGSESETRASSGPASSERASGILSPTHPSLGCLNLARQEKLQVTTLQASLTEEQNYNLHSYLHVWLFGVHSNHSGQKTVQKDRQ